MTAAANVPGGSTKAAVKLFSPPSNAGCYETTCEPTSQLDHGVRITCVDTFEGELTAGQYVEIQLNWYDLMHEPCPTDPLSFCSCSWAQLGGVHAVVRALG